MISVRKSSRIRKPITKVDQNVNSDDDTDENAFVTLTSRTSQQRASNKRASTDDNDERDTNTPRKRAKRKAPIKTSPYFNTNSANTKINTSIQEKKPVAKKNNKKTMIDRSHETKPDLTKTTINKRKFN
jgi:hypothetical protein